ncbi:FRG domain-containing protein [Lysobacter sp. cf310]|uniref:FRG domain-containing protein n=1 Tax=Lysobacter sp. cf310 TaxID=1761790 RepID=UPI0008E03553|nr:FRG domain-containing protein [Lysobacter sp. cf310]SFK47322.1 FRG domain-containing protein [Lysobacter sp. cf310]
MQTKEIKSLVEFIRESDSLGPFSDLVLFRGQAKQGNLLPGVARKNPKRDTTKEERQILQQLALQGASLLNGAGETELDRLIYAQHYGLKTRLLDWTSNPLAALWFACSDRCEGDVYVYSMEADDLLEKDVYSKDPFVIAKTRVIQPRMNNQRITAQSGWFTLHRYSKTSSSFVALDKNPQARKYLSEYRVPAKFRLSIIHSLDRHGVNASTLFPDIGGLCAHLNWRHRLAL